MRMARMIALLIAALTIGCGPSEGDEDLGVGGTPEDAIEAIDEVTGVDTVAGEGVSGPAPQRVVVEARSFAYQPSRIALAPGAVRFVVTNAADIVHGFEVEGHGMEEEIAEIAPGSTDSLLVTFETQGEYEIYCPVGDHQQRGMTGTVTVQ